MIEVLAARQFEAGPSGKLEIPPEYKEGYRYRVAIEFHTGVMRGWCGEVGESGPCVVLDHVLLDTSHRHNGVVLKSIRTYYPWIKLAFSPIMLMPFADDRPEEEE